MYMVVYMCETAKEQIKGNQVKQKSQVLPGNTFPASSERTNQKPCNIPGKATLIYQYHSLLMRSPT